ncbi:MAG: ROK family protein [Calditrichaeota bacterium]|nr:MAG: ROK family protein [Calditrichota bacterium]
MAKLVLGIDIGGTGIKSAPVDVEKGKLCSEPVKLSTPRPATPEGVQQVLKEIVARFAWSGPIGIGFPGVVKRGVIRTAANMDASWIGFPARERFRKTVGRACAIVNDADAAGMAEMRFGAGRSFYRHDGGTVLMITLGTGIGSALFVDGHLVPNTEFGHLEMDGRDAEKLAAASVKTSEQLSWEAWSERLNRFLQKVEFLLSPDVMIIGGGISAEWEIFFPLLDVSARLLPAQMGNDAGIVGAALACLRDRD